MSVDDHTVRRVLKAAEVETATIDSAASAEGKPQLKESHYTEIADAPKEQWEPLVEAAAKRKWTAPVTRLAVANLKDDRIPEAHKKKILAGTDDPYTFTAKGEPAIPVDVIAQQMKEALDEDGLVALTGAMKYVGRLTNFTVEEIVAAMKRERLEWYSQDIPRKIKTLDDILNEVRNTLNKKLEAVS